MAGDGEEEVDYESDPEEAKMSLTLRRREASDDEEEDGGEEGEMPPRRIDSRSGIGSDYESDGQGAAADYDEEESEIEEEEVDVEEEEEYELRVGESDGVHSGEVKATAVATAEAGKELDGDGRISVGKSTEFQGMNQAEEENEEIAAPIDGEYYAHDDQYPNNVGGRGEEEKKENEPFAVPTAGAFYMHDDRFRDSAGGRNRRTLGGRKLWESKDDRKWGHDKFEEMTMQERHYEEGRRVSRGRYRARGKNRSEDLGYPRVNRSKAYDNNSQNNAPKTVRGRGPRRYQPSTNNNSEAPTQHRLPGKSVERTSYASSGRVSASTSNIESDPVPTGKHVFASSLSSASPPFYPSGSSSKEINLTQKRDAQAGPINRNLRSSASGEIFSMPQGPQSNAMRGKNVADFIGMDKLYIDDSIPPLTGKPLTNLQMPPSGSSLIKSTQFPQSRVQGRGPTPSGPMSYQTTVPHNQVSRVSPPTQLHTVQRAPVQNRLQPSLQASGQQLGQRPSSGSQASSPPKAALSINSFESVEMESPSESSKSKTTLVGKGKGSVQGSGRGSFSYGGAQVMGASVNMGGGHGDKNFPATPSFLPVMQFGGQHPGGMGVPAVGMAFPGYVAQPQLGLGNSEMTWLPVLAGAAGALGATYCPPYLAVDGAYHARPSGPTSSLAVVSSKENNTNKPGNELEPSQRPELANDELGQRQNKARRYTEMKFDQ